VSHRGSRVGGGAPETALVPCGDGGRAVCGGLSSGRRLSSPRAARTRAVGVPRLLATVGNRYSPAPDRRAGAGYLRADPREAPRHRDRRDRVTALVDRWWDARNSRGAAGSPLVRRDGGVAVRGPDQLRRYRSRPPAWHRRRGVLGVRTFGVPGRVAF